MATGFPPTSQAYTTPPNSHGVHTAQNGLQQLSPSDSTVNTPTNQSPLSPHQPSDFSALPLTGRQLPKTALHVPAALRPTERPHRPVPLTPPRSLHGSTDSLDIAIESRPASRRSTASNTHLRHGLLSKLPEHEPAAINLQSSSSSISSETFHPIEGAPTRQHWKHDSHAPVCDAPTCHRSFNLFERRHHCRHCGHVFCNEHSSHRIPLDHDAEFHPEGALSRACQHCWDRYRAWRVERTSRANSLTSSLATATPGTPIPGTGGVPSAGEGLKGSVANSVPRDWNWSTF
ncbi:MAG: hypothetical protein LQ344_007213 [Seirophora lacunosa]|nr:MAG: hypothetical protein LQ344_007213 [Seirophora lacunosa]